MWKTNVIGKEQTWYSEEEYELLERKLDKYRKILYNIYKDFDTCNPIQDIEDYIEEESIMKELYKMRDEDFEKWKNSSARNAK